MSSTTSLASRDPVTQLYAVEGKAEIVDGRIVKMSPTGFQPGRASAAICFSLRSFEKKLGGFAIGENVGFLVDLPNRKSFSPNAAFYRGPASGMRFLQGAPVFAVEIRSENDYGPGAEKNIADKRAEYFAAGTKVVWDVDLIGDEPIRAYRAETPESPQVFHCGETANAKPAVPGWTFLVDELFD